MCPGGRGFCYTFTVLLLRFCTHVGGLAGGALVTLGCEPVPRGARVLVYILSTFDPFSWARLGPALCAHLCTPWGTLTARAFNPMFSGRGHTGRRALPAMRYRGSLAKRGTACAVVVGPTSTGRRAQPRGWRGPGRLGAYYYDKPGRAWGLQTLCHLGTKSNPTSPGARRGYA